MKPKDLKIPCSFENRYPLIVDRLFYIPEYYDLHRADLFPPFSEIFPNANPIAIEFCSGNGDWIIKKAEENPEINWVAVEIRFDRARKIWAKMHNQKLQNLFVVLGDGRTFAKHYLPEGSVDISYVNFPDPWPKNKHAKHRLVEKEFVRDLSSVIKEKGEVIFVTDDFETTERIIETMLENSNWKPFYPEPYFIHDLPNFGKSYFYSLWTDKGLKIHYMKFINSLS